MPPPAFAIAPRCCLVAVAGATGGVGRLLVARLLAVAAANADAKGEHHDNAALIDPPSRHLFSVTHVRALTRSPERARLVLPSVPALQLVQTAPLQDADMPTLRAALTGAAVVVICTGTTAFPTKAWSGGNVPSAADDAGVRRLVDAVDQDTIRRVVLLSTVGSTRARQMPFRVINLFGAVDAKAAAERHVRTAAKRGGFAFAIVRAGRLVGQPHSNVGMLRKEAPADSLDVAIERGDCLLGDVSRATVADALLYSAFWDHHWDLDFSIVQASGVAPGSERWKSLLRKVQLVSAEPSTV